MAGGEGVLIGPILFLAAILIDDRGNRLLQQLLRRRGQAGASPCDSSRGGHSDIPERERLRTIPIDVGKSIDSDFDDDVNFRRTNGDGCRFYTESRFQSSTRQV
jgi:hypothetical protein